MQPKPCTEFKSQLGRSRTAVAAETAAVNGPPFARSWDFSKPLDGAIAIETSTACEKLASPAATIVRAAPKAEDQLPFGELKLDKGTAVYLELPRELGGGRYLRRASLGRGALVRLCLVPARVDELRAVRHTQPLSAMDASEGA
eukprot:6192930-Pleurochrysis_carterae.AAC.5